MTDIGTDTFELEHPHDAFLTDPAQQRAVQVGYDMLQGNDDPLYHLADPIDRLLMMGRAVQQEVPTLEGGDVIGFMAACKAWRIADDVRRVNLL